MSRSDQPSPFSTRFPILIGLTAIALLVLGVGGWAFTVQISGAVIAPGVVVSASENKKVQHPAGGVVGQILVQEGSRVEAGQLLLRLDETVARANLAIVSRNLNELSARQARLRAERDAQDTIDFGNLLLLSREDADIRHIADSEERLFSLRRQSRTGHVERLRERILQLEKEAEGYRAQVAAKISERALIERELDGVRQLFAKGMVPITRLTTLERDAARIAGDGALIESKIAETLGRIAEVEVQILQIDLELSSETARELRDVEGRIGEFTERKVTAEDQLRRIDIRSPQGGYIHQLKVHTVGGVINAGEEIMTIVPDSDDLVVEIQIAPADIDQVGLGVEAVLRFSSFQQRNSPEISGRVSRISPDVTVEERSGRRYYLARVDINSTASQEIEFLNIISGMPVEAFIRTTDRTAIAFLTKPLSDQLNRAFRHE